jgi:hypothetical protein
MKKFALVAVFAIASVSCHCSPASRQAVAEIEDTQKLILPEYMNYVEQDPTLDADKKARRRALVESLERLVRQLRKGLEE